MTRAFFKTNKESGSRLVFSSVDELESHYSGSIIRRSQCEIRLYYLPAAFCISGREQTKFYLLDFIKSPILPELEIQGVVYVFGNVVETKEENKLNSAKQDIPNPPRYQDLNFSFLRRTANAMLEGHEKYEQDLKPFEKNYMRADLKFALGRVGNLIKHAAQLKEMYLYMLQNGLTRPEANVALKLELEDHLGHCAANLNMLAKWEEMGVLPNTEIKS